MAFGNRSDEKREGYPLVIMYKKLVALLRSSHGDDFN